MTNTSNSSLHFAGNFTQQEAIPDDAIQSAIQVMQSGRLHRYNVAQADELSETALLEVEYAQYQQSQFCLALASGGYALQTALRCLNVTHKEPILTNGFTLSPVPGAIAAVGGTPVLVETNEQLTIDLTHLEAQIKRSGSRILLLSHMRGHLADMDALCELLKKHNVKLIEDCAHTMGASFKGVKSGNHGDIACFSTQTYKHLNSGEGGFLTTNDEELMARAIILSGSYMLYERHAASPDAAVFEKVKLVTPNCSGRMDNLRAAILRPQLNLLDNNCKRWNERYRIFQQTLAQQSAITQPTAHEHAHSVHSSIQFSIPAFLPSDTAQFLQQCIQRGVELKWFGAAEPAAYTSRYDSWQYFESDELPNTRKTLSCLFDCRIPLTFSVEDCEQIALIINDVVASLLADAA